MDTELDDKLEQFLTQCGLAWSVIPWERHTTLNNEWENLYGNCQHWLRNKEGGKAQFEYSQQPAETFLIVPFLGNVAGPQSINKPGPRKAAYECHGDGVLPDLSAFADTDFFIVPADFTWTIWAGLTLSARSGWNRQGRGERGSDNGNIFTQNHTPSPAHPSRRAF